MLWCKAEGEHRIYTDESQGSYACYLYVLLKATIAYFLELLKLLLCTNPMFLVTESPDRVLPTSSAAKSEHDFAGVVGLLQLY